VALKQVLEFLWGGKRGDVSLTARESNIFGALAGPATASGEHITADSALRVSAVFACVRVLAETVASLPLHIYRRGPGGQKTIARDHALYSVLHSSPFPGASSMVWRETMMAWLAMHGNAYAIVRRAKTGDAIYLQPWHPDAVKIERAGYDPRYKIRTADGQDHSVAPGAMLHIKALCLDGSQLKGLSPIAYARETIGLSMAQEKHGAALFGNGARPGGVLEVDGSLAEEDRLRLAESWRAAHSGSGNAHRTAVLEDGVHWKPIAIPNEDAQWLESRKFGVTDIARIFRVPPQFIGDLERATFSNVEQQSIDFVVHTIRPFLVRFEQEINATLFVESDRDEYFAEFSVDGLLRGDTATRFQAYSVGRNWGWLSANDIRALENQNPVDGGDVYLQPLNMVEAGAPPPKPLVPPAAPEPQPDDESPRARTGAEYRNINANRRRIRSVWRALISEGGKRLVRAEIREIRKMLPQSRFLNDTFSGKLEAFYATDFGRLVRDIMGPILSTFSAEIMAAAADETGNPADVDLAPFVSEYLDTLALRHSISSRGQIEALARDADGGEDAIGERLDQWDAERGERIGHRESVQFSEAVAVASFVAWSVTRLRWVANSDACPLCAALDGKVVGIEKNFVGKGDTVNPNDGVTSPLTSSGNVGHAPLHAGCECSVVAD